MNNDPEMIAGCCLWRMSSPNRSRSEGIKINRCEITLVKCVMCLKILRRDLDREEFGAKLVISL